MVTKKGNVSDNKDRAIGSGEKRTNEHAVCSFVLEKVLSEILPVCLNAKTFDATSVLLSHARKGSVWIPITNIN